MSAVISDAEAIESVAANAMRLMHAQGLSVRKLAEKTGETRMTIYRAITGTNEPGIAVIAKIAEALDVTVDELLELPKTIRRKVS